MPAAKPSVETPRGFHRLELRRRWVPIGPQRWLGEGGAVLELDDVLDSLSLEPERLVECHQTWSEQHGLNAQQTRLEETPLGTTVLRSFGETRTDDFLLVAHLWTEGRLTRLSLRSPLERLSDIDLSDILSALLNAHPHPGDP